MPGRLPRTGLREDACSCAPSEPSIPSRLWSRTTGQAFPTTRREGLRSVLYNEGGGHGPRPRDRQEDRRRAQRLHRRRPKRTFRRRGVRRRPSLRSLARHRRGARHRRAGRSPGPCYPHSTMSGDSTLGRARTAAASTAGSSRSTIGALGLVLMLVGELRVAPPRPEATTSGGRRPRRPGLDASARGKRDCDQRRRDQDATRRPAGAACLARFLGDLVRAVPRASPDHRPGSASLARSRARRGRRRHRRSRPRGSQGIRCVAGIDLSNRTRSGRRCSTSVCRGRAAHSRRHFARRKGRRDKNRRHRCGRARAAGPSGVVTALGGRRVCPPA